MSQLPADPCAVCKKREENFKTGKLLKTSDGRKVAHYNCMICDDCKKGGATIVCYVNSCMKTYHNECVQQNMVIYSPENENEHDAWLCSQHAYEKKANVSTSYKDTCTSSSYENSAGTSRQDMEKSSASQALNWEHAPDIGPSWKKRKITRKSGKNKGRSFFEYKSPTEKRYRSKEEIDRELYVLRQTRLNEPTEKMNLSEDTMGAGSQMSASSGTEANVGPENPLALEIFLACLQNIKQVVNNTEAKLLALKTKETR